MKKYKQHPIQIEKLPSVAGAENALAKTLQEYCEDDIHQLERYEKSGVSFNLKLVGEPDSKWKVYDGWLKMRFNFLLRLHAGLLMQDVTFNMSIYVGNDGNVKAGYWEKTGVVGPAACPSFERVYNDIIPSIQDSLKLGLREIDGLLTYMLHLKHYVKYADKSFSDKLDFLNGKHYKVRAARAGWFYSLGKKI